MIRRVLVIAAATLGAAVFVARGTAQSNPPVDYHALIESYRLSGPAEVDQLLSIPRDRLNPVVDDAIAEQSGWKWDDLRGAAMLHTEAALRLARDRDGRGADFHLLAAQRLLARVTALSAPQEDFEWRWHFAVAAMSTSFERPRSQSVCTSTPSRDGRDARVERNT